MSGDVLQAERSDVCEQVIRHGPPVAVAEDVLHTMERIADAGAGFRSVTESIDTTTPAGRMMMQMVGSFAEDRVGGRRKKLDAAKRCEIAESVISGRKTGAEMARLYNVSAPTVSRIVAAHRTSLTLRAVVRPSNKILHTMKKTRIALAICLASLIPIGAHSQRTFAPGGIIDPRLVGPTDPDYAPPFFIGPLIFKIPNRFLIFPWPTGQHPFDRSVCAEPTAVKDPVDTATCKSDHQSVFLKIPIPGFLQNAQNNGAVSLVTLGFHELMGSKWLGYQGSAEEYGAEHDDRWARMRVPELDTKEYAAFHDAWTGEWAKQAPPNILAQAAGDYTFISKSIEDQPRVLTCQTVLNTEDALHKLRCNATIPFLPERYPQEPSGRYPYTITFDLPGDEIDAAAEVGRRITQAILAFLSPPASTK